MTIIYFSVYLLTVTVSRRGASMRGRVADGICGLSDRRNLLLSGLHALDLIVLGCILLWIILALLYMGKRKKDKEDCGCCGHCSSCSGCKSGRKDKKN